MRDSRQDDGLSVADDGGDKEIKIVRPDEHH